MWSVHTLRNFVPLPAAPSHHHCQYFAWLSNTLPPIPPSPLLSLTPPVFLCVAIHCPRDTSASTIRL